MPHPHRLLASAVLAILIPLGSAEALLGQQSTVERSSHLPGLSPRSHPDFVRESVFIPMRDGTRLAADVFRPARGTEPEARELPLVWMHDRYQRAMDRGGRIVRKIDQPLLRELVRRGYVVAAVDVRGAGASFGVYAGPFNPQETRDAFEVMEWFTAQPWCDGNLGMYGGSYLGATQYMAASTGSPHLKAIIPSVAPGDLYAFCYPGGIWRDDFMRKWTELTIQLDTLVLPAPVDGPDGPALLQEAVALHSRNRNTYEQYRAAPFRDSHDPQIGAALFEACSPLHHVKPISESGVAVYHLAGWMDCFTRDAFVLYRNLPGPQRLAIGSWYHQQRHRFDDLGEHLRWYDRWLKGIENGVDEEPPVHYFVQGAPRGQEWRAASAWPLPKEERRTYYLQPPQGEAPGLLAAQRTREGRIEYAVDYEVSMGLANRWTNGYGGPAGYPDLGKHDARSMSFTTPALEADVEVTGHPVARLWVQSTARDGDFFVYLEEVDENGGSQYVTEGCLRASHRTLASPPYDYLGLPYHRSYEKDVQQLPEEPVELVLDLQPTSNLFDGHRIRVSIACADAANCLTPRADPAPTVTLYCEEQRASSVELPIIPVGE